MKLFVLPIKVVHNTTVAYWILIKKIDVLALFITDIPEIKLLLTWTINLF